MQTGYIKKINKQTICISPRRQTARATLDFYFFSFPSTKVHPSLPIGTKDGRRSHARRHVRLSRLTHKRRFNPNGSLVPLGSLDRRCCMWL
jgi:hypothetical protein